MSTRFKINKVPSLGTERFYKYNTLAETVDDFHLPSCGIEDVDRALFNLFDKDLNFINTEGGQTKKVPVIFATGERAFLLRNKIPLHDVNETLILPIISIVRSSIEQGSESGVGPGNGEMVISKKISKKNGDYKVLADKDLKNKAEKSSITGYRNTGSKIEVQNTSTDNIYEIITMPSPRYFKVTYEITFWTHYQTQMNNMLEILMQSYNINPARSFRIETDKGYWFVATVDQSFSQQSNTDSYAEDERMVRQSFSVNVNGYLINPSGDGHLPVLKKYTSAPMLNFTLQTGDFENKPTNNVASSDPDDYIYKDFQNEADPLPTRVVAKKGELNDGIMRETNIIKSNRIVSKVNDPFSSKNVRANIQKGSKGELIIKVLE